MKAQRMIMAVALAIVVALLSAGAVAASVSTAATTDDRPLRERIRFSPGATSTIVRGVIGPDSPARYVFHARAGQTADVSFDAVSSANWTLASPDGQPLKTTMGEARDATITLPETGDYDLTVVGTSWAGFGLTLEIQPPLREAARVERIRFTPGGTSGTVTGTAAEGVHPRYVFGARAGQVAYVRITSSTGGANWALTGPSGQPLKRMASEARSGVVDLPETGDYRLSIGAPRAGIGYRLTLEIPAR